MNNDINIVIKYQGQPDGREGHSAGQALAGNGCGEEGPSANVRGDAQEPSEAILNRDESYEPMPARRKEIDKPDGGVRLLGIPTVLDRLMARLATKVTEKRVLKLIRKYLRSGVMIDGLEAATEEGTPQGGPLSPLLSNIVLDDLDKELEKRGKAQRPHPRDHQTKRRP